MATVSSAVRSQLPQNVRACGSRKLNRARFTGREGPANAGAYSARASGFAASTSRRPFSTKAGTSVIPSGLAEPQGPAERVEQALGHPGEVTPLELGVVLDADSGQVGDLAAAQAGHPAVAAVVRQPGLLGGDLGPAGAEEGPDLVAV